MKIASSEDYRIIWRTSVCGSQKAAANQFTREFIYISLIFNPFVFFALSVSLRCMIYGTIHQLLERNSCKNYSGL